MLRADLLRRLNGFDQQFFYHFEEVDLCYRVWQAGYPIRFTPKVVITHLGGQSVGRFPIRFAVEKSRSRYRYFYKHFGRRGAKRCRQVELIHLRLRQIGHGLVYLFRPKESMKNRLEMLRVAACWNRLIDPVAFVERGAEPQVDA